MAKDKLTEMQLKFLVYLFEDEAGGDIRAAMDLAGYSKTTPQKDVIEPLADIMSDLALKKLAGASVKAALGLVSVLNDPNQLGAANRIKAAESILSRVGAAKREDVRLNIPDSGLVMIPAKRVRVIEENGTEDDA